MSSNAITHFTHRNLFDHLRISGISWYGQKSESDFLERVFTISKLPSNDYRVSTMEGDVHLHRENFSDWGGEDWVYDDGRLDLIPAPIEFNTLPNRAIRLI